MSKFTHIFIIAMYASYILMGFVWITVSVMMATASDDDFEEYAKLGFDQDLESKQRTAGVVMAIGSSVLNIGIGIFGLLCIQRKQQFHLRIVMALLFFSIVVDVVTILFIIIAAATKSTTEKFRNKILHEYGNFTGEAKTTTEALDKIQRKRKCCGFSGDESENLFLKSPWYKTANFNGEKKRTLPEACCLKPECVYAKNLKDAREKKLVHEDDCLAEMESGSALVLKLLHPISTIIMAAVIIYFTKKIYDEPASE